MKMRRLVFSFITILLLFSNFGFSQHSTYQDAKDLAEMIRKKQVPKFDFSKCSSNEFTPFKPYPNILLKDGEKEPLLLSEKVKNVDYLFLDYNFPSVGVYELRNQDNTPDFLSSSDTLQIFIGDTMVNIVGDSLLDGVKVNFNLIRTEVFKIYLIPGNGLNFREEKIFSLETNFMKMLEILNAHVNLKSKTSNFNNFSLLESVPKKYDKNPFFNRNLQKKILLDENSARFLQSNFFELPSAPERKEGWEQLMYGDSVLQFQKTISFQDLSDSYRDPITSKNELDIANSRINESSKNRGFLDAKTVAVGLSDFIAERAQEELNLTFFHRFKENLEKPSELTVLFPNTKNLLYQFEISNYKTLLANARESFTVDLDNLGLNFPRVLELEKYRDLYNSPEVYNLALIYSIADLAYREVPVEKILISGFKKLEGRKIELGKSIDNELAKSILSPNKMEKKEKRNKKSAKENKRNLPIIIKGTELSRLQKYTEEYLNALDSCQEEIKKDLNLFYNIVDNEIQRDTPVIKRQTLAKNYKLHQSQLVEIHNMNNRNIMKSGSLIDNIKQKGKIIYFGRNIEEDSILNFYRNTIFANLQQKEYFDYLFQNPSLEDYDLVFKSKPRTNENIVAQGIAGTRQLIGENFDHHLVKKLENLKTYSAEARTLKEELLRIEKQNEGIHPKVFNFVTRADLLKLAIEEEINFWQKISNKDKSSQEIASLYFLKALTQDDDYIKLFRDVLMRASNSNMMEYVIFNSYYNTLGTQFQATLNIGNERLDSIQINLSAKINELKIQYGNQKINPKLYAQKAMAFDAIEKKAAIDLEIQAAEKEFVQNRKKVEDSVAEKMESDPEYENLQNQLSSFQAEIDAINEIANDENRPTTEEEKEKISQLNNQKDGINNQLNALEEKYEEEMNQLMLPLKEERDEKLNALNLEKENLKNPLANFPSNPNLEKRDSFPILKKNYQLSDNKFLKLYEKEKINQTQIDSSQFASYDKLDKQLAQETINLQQLQQKNQQLRGYLTALENEYCKDLVDAKVNAQNLSKGLELSTHILLAFRDYENISKPITYTDTARIVITQNKVDAEKGYILGTATLDSLDIQEKIIKETSIDTTIAKWITFEKFDSLRRDPLEWNLFLGLLYQRLSAIEDAPNFSASGTALLATKFFSIANDMENTRTNLRIKKATRPSDLTFKDYYPFIRSTVDLFNTIITTQSIGDSTLQDTYKSLTNIPQISNQALSLYENIYVKEYGNAILNAMELLKIITDKKLTSKEQRQSTRAINAVLIYGTFMANMVQAQTSNQVKNIMKSATLPPGSSRIKRETTSSFTVNSYLGAAIGRDRLLDVPTNIDLPQDAFGASLSVPIGFTYSFSPNIIKNNSSFSIHVPLLDLGAITAYRQNPKNQNYKIDNLPDFSWNNLFSPGAFVVYNFANSPFSLGVGGQYGPQLREIKLDTGDPVNVNSWRFPMAFFTIDVPFFNLYTGSRKIIVK
jgi:hypothetical protein